MQLEGTEETEGSAVSSTQSTYEVQYISAHIQLLPSTQPAKSEGNLPEEGSEISSQHQFLKKGSAKFYLASVDR